MGVTGRLSKTNLFHSGDRQRVEIDHEDKSFVDRAILEDWVKDTLVPEVERRRGVIPSSTGPV
jgi:hypothetical protein